MSRPPNYPLRPPRRTWRDAFPPALRRWWSGAPQLALENTAAFLLPSLLPLRPQDRVLEIGCGTGALGHYLTERVSFLMPVVGADTRAALLRRGAHTADIRLIQAAPVALPFPERHFTVIVVGHQIRDWEDETLTRFLREAWRVLTHNGVLVLWEVAPSRSPTVNAIWAQLLATPGRPLRLRTFAEIGHTAREAGFAWIQTLRLQPMLWPPGPRVAALLLKEYYDAETVTLRPGETPDYRPSR